MKPEKDTPYFFYLARCADHTLYAGIAKDVGEREMKHNAGQGAKYTKTRRPVRVVHWERCATRGEALRREAEVKRWPRSKKLLLIAKRRKKP